MAKCELNLETIKRHVNTGLRKVVRTRDIQLAREYLTLCINWINDEETGFIINNSLDSLAAAGAVLEMFNQTGFPAMDPTTFLLENISNSILEVQSGILKTDTLAASTDRLVDTYQIFVRALANKLFLEDAYGLAKDVRLYAVSKTNQMMFDAMFVNRGSIKDANLGIVKSDAELNTNIRKYQLQLFDVILKYLKQSAGTNENLQNLPERVIMFDDKGEVTSAFKNLFKIALQRLSPSTLNTDLLRGYFEALQKDPTSEQGIHLEAYNAFVVLSNFDSYVDQLFGKVVKILNFGQLGGNKYSIAEQTANVNKTWRTNDNIVVSDEVDNVTKLLINTTPLYSTITNKTISGMYLSFLDFEYLIGKIKDLIYNPDVYKINFDLEWISNNSDVWNSLSEDTRKVLENKRLSRAINSIRFNPKKTVHAFFELFSNNDFLETEGLLKLFSLDEKNKMYSLFKEVFNPNSPNSIYTLTKTKSSHDFYEYLTLTADSIFKIKYLQYYRDLDGIVKVRTLLDANMFNVERKIRLTINGGNHKSLYRSFDEYKNKYGIQVVENEKTKRPTEVVVTIPGTNILASIMLNSGKIFWTLNGHLIDNILTLLLNNISFLDDVLHLNLEQNQLLLTYLRESYDSETVLSENLFNLAARTVAVSAINQSYFTNKDIHTIIEDIPKVFGNQIKYDYALDLLNLVMDVDGPTITTIAEARSNLLGMTTASIVRDGEGNAQSNQSLSRLMGSYPSLFDLLIALEGSALHDSILVSVDGLFKGIYNAKEYHSDDADKNVVVMTPDEMVYSNIVHDFIGGLLPSYTAIGNGIVGFLPSVNSDKSTAARILIDLNTEINGKPLREFSVPEIKSLISLEFGKIYKLMWDNVTSDWGIVDGLFPELSPGLTFSKDFAKDFKNINDWWMRTHPDVSLSDTIKKRVLEYNRSHRLKPLALIDQVHFIEKKVELPNGKVVKGLLGTNETFAALLARFSPKDALYRGIETSNYVSEATFWNRKNREVINSLLKAGVTINTTNISQSELLNIRELYPDWIDSSGNLVLAKVDGHNITSVIDVYKIDDKTNYQVFINKAKKVEVNPIIEKYNLFEYLFTLEWMNSTVGSFIAHPNKSKAKHSGKYQEGTSEYKWEHGNIVLEQEASQFAAQHKRNVSFTAAMYAFQLNTLNGIPTDYNIAVIDDIKDELGTIPGILSSIKPFDGATFVNPFVVYLENNSLGGAKAGITKKLFVHFYDERTGTGGIIKTAGFGLTNDWIRNSLFLLKMMWKMTHHTWINEDETPAIVDITSDYNGNKIQYDDIFYKGEDGIAYKVIASSIQSLGNNKYTYSILNQKTGEITSNLPITIDNNYTLWKFFGGENSLKETKGGLVFSNTSVENVVKAINNCAGLDANGKIIKKSDKIETLEDLWQPLKHSDVHYIPTAGAVKQGAANINSASKYADGDPNNMASGEDYNILRIHMYQSGILLDKEHHADQSEISMMTLVISACAARGFTFEASSLLYDALRIATDLGLKEHFGALEDFFSSKSRDSLQEVVMKAIIDNLGNSSVNTGNFAQAIAADIIKAAKSGEKIVYKDLNLPLSDPTVRAKVMSVISVFLTNSGIKNKIPGILSVLTPSYNIFKLYNNKKLENTTLEELQLELDKITNAIGSDYLFKVNDDGTGTFVGKSLVAVESGMLTNDEGQVIPFLIKGNTILVDLLAYTNDSNLETEILEALLIEKYPRNSYSARDIKQGEYEVITNTGETIIITANDTLTLLDIKNKIQDGTYTSVLETQNAYQQRILKEIHSRLHSISNIELGRTYILVKADGSIENRLVNTPVDYMRLKKEVLSERVVSVRENIMVGRDLAAYNVRFSTDNYENFLLWDLDSAQTLYRINSIRSLKNKQIQELLLQTLFKSLGLNPGVITSEKVDDILNGLYSQYQKLLQQDLFNLSGETNTVLEEFDKLYELAKTLFEAGKDFSEADSRARYFAALRLGLHNVNELPYTQEVIEGKITKQEWHDKVREALEQLTYVSINGSLVKVNKDSIKTLAYEIIMPRVFASNFGLSEFDDLYTILNDPDYFIKQAIRKQELGNSTRAITLNNYTVKLLRSNGDHQYILDKKMLPLSTNLSLVLNVMTIQLDDKTYRVDLDGNTLYLIMNPGSDLIYTDGEHEIIVTDSPISYVENLHYDNIQLSGSLLNLGEIVKLLMSDFKKSKKKRIQRFYRAVKSKSPREVILKSHSLYKITEDNYNDPMFANHPVVVAGRAKHSSFLKSLDIVAARIPAQSMQSFMPMKCVAFDNPDINTAHVSTLLVLLLGSDYPLKSW